MYDLKDLSLPTLMKNLTAMKDGDASQHEKYLAAALTVVLQNIEDCHVSMRDCHAKMEDCQSKMKDCHSKMQDCQSQMKDCQSKMQKCESEVGRLAKAGV